MTISRVLLTGSLLLCFACNDEPAGNHGTLIGLTCESSEECDIGGTCLIDGKDGMCAQPCQEPGAAQECPLGSYCDQGEFTSDTEDKSLMTLCLPSCKVQSDCREGYECTAVSGGPGKVCHPT